MAKDPNRVYVGNLPLDVTKEQVGQFFSNWGEVTYVDFKQTKTGRCAFVGYYDRREADDAVMMMNGAVFHGRRLRVEFPNGLGPRGRNGQPMNNMNNQNARIRRPAGQGIQRRTDFRVQVRGIPETGSWQDIKDHVRAAGEVVFADIRGHGIGIVEFEEESSVRKCVEMFHLKDFTSHYICLRGRHQSQSAEVLRGQSVEVLQGQSAEVAHLAARNVIPAPRPGPARDLGPVSALTLVQDPVPGLTPVTVKILESVPGTAPEPVPGPDPDPAHELVLGPAHAQVLAPALALAPVPVSVPALGPAPDQGLDPEAILGPDQDPDPEAVPDPGPVQDPAAVPGPGPDPAQDPKADPGPDPVRDPEAVPGRDPAQEPKVPAFTPNHHTIATTRGAHSEADRALQNAKNHIIVQVIADQSNKSIFLIDPVAHLFLVVFFR